MTLLDFERHSFQLANRIRKAPTQCFQFFSLLEKTGFSHIVNAVVANLALSLDDILGKLDNRLLQHIGRVARKPVRLLPVHRIEHLAKVGNSLGLNVCKSPHCCYERIVLVGVFGFLSVAAHRSFIANIFRRHEYIRCVENRFDQLVNIYRAFAGSIQSTENATSSIL